MFRPCCVAILIGSLPLTDHDQAVRLILGHSPEIPQWPQLPQLPRQGMIRQFLSGLPGLTEVGKNYWIDTADKGFPAAMAAFYDEYLEVIANPARLMASRFVLGPDTAAGFFALLPHLASAQSLVAVKGQITGPITTGIGVKDEAGRPIIYDANLRDMLTKLLTEKARWQVEELRRASADRCPAIVFIDEPGMVSFGSTGFSGVSEEMVTAAVGETIAGIHQAGGLAGVHICANGDWGPVLLSATDIISFDAYSYFANFCLYRRELMAYLSRGGILAWGIIPTGDPVAIAAESVDSLFEKWLEQVGIVAGYGIEVRQLLSQTLIAPSCGTGSLPQALALKVLTMTGELSRRARRYLEKLS